VFPSLKPLRPNGAPSWLSIEGLPKIGCRRIFVVLVGIAFVRPDWTFIQAPTILFHIEHWIVLNFGAPKIQLTSEVSGPMLCTGNLI